MNWKGSVSSQLSKIAWITVAWTIVSLFQFGIGFAYVRELGLETTMDPFIPFRISILTGILAGILGGSGVVFLWERWLRTKPYGWTLRSILITYVIIFVLVGYPTNMFYYASLTETHWLEPEVLSSAWERLFSPGTFVPLTTWLFIVVFTIIALQVNDKYGPGVFRKFLLGRYFEPRREERIFMFLDLRSSTTIAEQLGEEKYFAFLREVFQYATPAILRHDGEIYQYVGDEIVISWEMDKGIKNANCINAYFDIQEELNQRKSYFEEKYSAFPEFKAGVHQGHVMAGEIGVVKREIAYSGDVLNTASRIQSKCNELGVNLLFSGDLIQRISMTGLSPWELGDIELRGKQERVKLYTLQV